MFETLEISDTGYDDARTRRRMSTITVPRHRRARSVREKILKIWPKAIAIAIADNGSAQLSRAEKEMRIKSLCCSILILINLAKRARGASPS